MRTLKSQRGFTLLEVIMAAIIVGILALAILPSVIGSDQDAKKSRAESDLKQIVTAAELYRIHNGSWPADLATLTTYNATTNPQPFVAVTPTDPYSPTSAAYQVAVTGTAPNDTFWVWSVGPNGTSDSHAGDDIARSAVGH